MERRTNIKKLYFFIVKFISLWNKTILNLKSKSYEPSEFHDFQNGDKFFSLQIHVKYVHENVKLIQCQKCPKSFHTTHNYKSHLNRTHLKVREYS